MMRVAEDQPVYMLILADRPRAACASRRPDAEEIEISLLRLYRLSEARSAAAEQYATMRNAVRREIGVEPPTLDMV